MWSSPSAPAGADAAEGTRKGGDARHEGAAGLVAQAIDAQHPGLLSVCILHLDARPLLTGANHHNTERLGSHITSSQGILVEFCSIGTPPDPPLVV